MRLLEKVAKIEVWKNVRIVKEVVEQLEKKGRKWKKE